MMAVSVDEKGRKRSITTSSSCTSLTTILARKQTFPGDTIRFDNLGRVDKHLRPSSYFTRHGAHPYVSRYDETED